MFTNDELERIYYSLENDLIVCMAQQKITKDPMVCKAVSSDIKDITKVMAKVMLIIKDNR